jgi:hypothetical protein
MGILDRIPRKPSQPFALPPTTPPQAPPPAPTPPQSPAQQAPSELATRREQLAQEVAELHWDLGGLAYEMAIRDHFRLDVLMRRAAVLQERDAELAEVERLLRTEHDGIAGACPACGAPRSRLAVFCWQCGAGLMEQVRPDGEPTAVMDALLGPQAPEHRQAGYDG